MSAEPRGKLTAAPAATLETKGGQGAAVSDAQRRAADGLAELVPQALAAIAESLAGGKRARYASSRSADARWLLDVVLDRAPAEQEAQKGSARIDPEAAVVELRKRLGGK